MSYNIRYGGGGREAALAATIAATAPDVIILQEATDPRVVAKLAERLQMPYWGAQSRYSLAFISKIKIDRYEWHPLFGVRRPYLEIVPADIDVRLYGVHLSAIHSNWTEARRGRELRAILNDIKDYKDNFHIITGDFNTLAPGEILDLNQ